ncbi:MAG: DUF2316 family protein [Lentilactobacillus hilgardii]|uniref:DUF2316 family protein n=2 Tax=Lentilactobacillus hilgardii TaxID=1588 RepID=UPI001D9FC108|nr:DUF2316 family protein [Lentilactobacillus hilgardii]MBZ2200600.1 hypothetical protein [Lentilactobacillus hilgardii]MBZ2204036.1 DUF2316 domain-containing protein [Lentilactobacillus hilgardii]
MMSLTADEAAATIEEFQQNFELAGVSLDTAAKDLHTSPLHLKQVMNLNVTRIEEPWILRNYLVKIILNHEKEPVPFSKLTGNPKRYRFLNNQYIEEGKLA